MTVKIYFTGATSDLGNEVKRLQMRIAKAVQLLGFSNIKPYRGLSRVLGNSLARFLGGSGGGSLLFYPVGQLMRLYRMLFKHFALHSMVSKTVLQNI